MTPLHTSAEATLDADGAGRLAIGPVTPGTVWRVTTMTTNGNSTTEPTLRIYRGGVGDAYMIDTTERGNSDVSDSEVSLQTGETISAEWRGGTPGAQMILRLEGQITSRWESQ